MALPGEGGNSIRAMSLMDLGWINPVPPVLAQPSPYPPPPGVFTSTLSPGSTSIRNSPGRVSLSPSARVTLCSPRAASPPPASPNGASLRREERNKQGHSPFIAEAPPSSALLGKDFRDDSARRGLSPSFGCPGHGPASPVRVPTR